MKKLGKILKDRRGDISSPIIVILVTVAALAVAGMAVAWMASTGGKASSQGSLVVLGTPMVTSTSPYTFYITVKNIGNSQVTITSVRLGAGTWTGSQNVAAGASVALSGSLSGTGLTFNSGQTYTGAIVTDSGTVQFTAYCQ